MKECGKNPQRHKAVDQRQGTSLSPSQRLIIGPAPKETGTEQLYRVVYVIDVGGSNPQQAAEHAFEIMKDPASMRPVLDVLDVKGHLTRVDLSRE